MDQKAEIYSICKVIISIENYEPQAYRRWCNFRANLANTNIVTDEANTAVAPTTTILVEVNPPTTAIVRVHVEENLPALTSSVGEVSTPSSSKKKYIQRIAFRTYQANTKNYHRKKKSLQSCWSY